MKASELLVCSRNGAGWYPCHIPVSHFPNISAAGIGRFTCKTFQLFAGPFTTRRLSDKLSLTETLCMLDQTQNRHLHPHSCMTNILTHQSLCLVIQPQDTELNTELHCAENSHYMLFLCGSSKTKQATQLHLVCRDSHALQETS